MVLLSAQSYTNVTISSEELCIVLDHKLAEIKAMEDAEDRYNKCIHLEGYIREVQRKKLNEEILLFYAIGTRLWFWVMLPGSFVLGAFLFLYSRHPDTAALVTLILASSTAWGRRWIAIMVCHKFVNDVINRDGVERTLMECLDQVLEIKGMAQVVERARDPSIPRGLNVRTSA